MTNDNMTTAPVYRYITTNLLTDEVLAEIPFQGVSYGRTLKSSGSFSGTIPVIPQTRSMNLFESTMPGRTALYVLRNGVCVWGGIIWDSKYNGESKALTVSASEFPSYLNRRAIWRNLDLSHKATLTLESETASAYLSISDDSFTDGFVPFSTVHIAFPNESEAQYSGYYKVAPSPTPTGISAALTQYYSHDVLDLIHKDGVIDLHTREEHHWEIGGVVSLRAIDEFPEMNPLLGDWRIVGVDSLDKTRAILSGPPGSTTLPSWSEGDVSVARRLPLGVYEDVTVTTHADTHHFVRYLIESTMRDFSQLPVDPAEDPSLGVHAFVDINRVVRGVSSARLHTTTPHGLSAGQSVTLRNLSNDVNGVRVIHRIISPTEFEVLMPGGTPSDLQYAPSEIRFTSLGIDNGDSATEPSLVHVTTAEPHLLSGGDYIEVTSASSDPRSTSGAVNGRYVVTAETHSDSNAITYETTSRLENMTREALTPPTFTWSGTTYSVVSVKNDGVTTKISYSGSPRVPSNATGLTFSNFGVSVPIQDISYDKKAQKVWVETKQPHVFQTGDAITLRGVQAQHNVWSVDAQSASPHRANITFTDSVNFRDGDMIDIENVMDAARIVSRQGVGGRAQLVLDRPQWFDAAETVTITDLVDTLNVTRTEMEPGKVTFVTDDPAHTIPVGSKVTVAMEYSRLAYSFQIDHHNVIFRTSSPHNFVAGAKARITSSSMPGLVGTYTIRAVTDLEVMVTIDDIKDKALKDKSHLAQRDLSGTILVSDKHPGGDDGVVIETTATSVTIASPQARNVEVLNDRVNSTISGPSFLNGTHDIYALTGRGVLTLDTPYAPGTHAKYTYPKPEKDASPQDVYNFSNKTMGRVRAWSKINGTRKMVRRINDYTIQVELPDGLLTMENGYNYRSLRSGNASIPSRFNGTHNVTVQSPTEFWWSSTAYPYSMTERPAGSTAQASLPISALVASSVSDADTSSGTITFTKARPPVNEFFPFGLVTARVRPGADFNTFGPFPNNASINFEFSDYSMSAINKMPPSYRGYELTTVGKALNEYLSDLQGFDYRVDVAYDEETSTFTKQFVFVSNQFPDAPIAGELSPISRFGADKIVFEHPGNISKYSLDQRASTSATRFFMVGRNPWGTDVPSPYAAASDAESLAKGWPLLDGDAKNASTYDISVLHGYGKKELSESRPPQSDIQITVNGSLQPEVGTYLPGDWCSVVINDDDYISQWMQSDLEPRDTVVIRKIDGYKVKVPDGIAFPETVDLDLIPEWEVDRLGD